MYIVSKMEEYVTFWTVESKSLYTQHLPSVHLSKVQKGVYYLGIHVFNYLPARIKSLSVDVRKFKTALKGFLLERSFYTIQEYFDWELINK